MSQLNLDTFFHVYCTFLEQRGLGILRVVSFYGMLQLFKKSLFPIEKVSDLSIYSFIY